MGIFQLIAYIFGYLLKFWFWLCGNYGVAVVLFSVTIKAVMFPLSLKQQKSLKKNQELQPKLAELQRKYADNQEQLAAEYQKFIKENKFSPLSGCLLSIGQIFVLLGVLYVVTNPMKYMEKYSTEEINEALQESLTTHFYSGDNEEYARAVTNFYFDDESGEKELLSGDIFVKANEDFLEDYKKKNRYHELKILGDKYDLTFLGINLGEITAQNPSDIRLWIFPVLTTIFYYISLWMMSKKQKTPQKIKDADGNEIEMPNMMMMNITMPIMSGFISYSVPQGMGLYWFTNSFIQIIIQLVSDKIINKNNESQKTSDSNGGVVLPAVEAIKEDEEDDKTDDTEVVHEEKNEKKEGKKSKKSSKKKKK